MINILEYYYNGSFLLKDIDEYQIELELNNLKPGRKFLLGTVLNMGKHSTVSLSTWVYSITENI